MFFDYLFNSLLALTARKSSTFRISGVCLENTELSGGWLHKASNVESVSVAWCHFEYLYQKQNVKTEQTARLPRCLLFIWRVLDEMLKWSISPYVLGKYDLIKNMSCCLPTHIHVLFYLVRERVTRNCLAVYLRETIGFQPGSTRRLALNCTSSCPFSTYFTHLTSRSFICQHSAIIETTVKQRPLSFILFDCRCWESTVSRRTTLFLAP